MKKRMLILAAALLLGLSGCISHPAEESQAETPSPSPTARPSSAPSLPVETPQPTGLPTPAPHPTQGGGAAASRPPVSTPAPTSAPISTPSPSLEPERPADEAVLAAYREASEAYSWFAGYGEEGLMLDREDVEVRPDLTFYRVTRPGLGTLDELRGYLKSLFSDEIVDPLLAETPGVPHFIETEKGLYALPAGRGSDVTKGAVTLEVLWHPEGTAECTVKARVELLDGENLEIVVGEQVYEFPYQKVGTKWVFTQFESIF